MGQDLKSKQFNIIKQWYYHHSAFISKSLSAMLHRTYLTSHYTNANQCPLDGIIDWIEDNLITIFLSTNNIPYLGLSSSIYQRKLLELEFSEKMIEKLEAAFDLIGILRWISKRLILEQVSETIQMLRQGPRHWPDRFRLRLVIDYIWASRKALK